MTGGTGLPWMMKEWKAWDKNGPDAKEANFPFWPFVRDAALDANRFGMPMQPVRVWRNAIPVFEPRQ